MSQYPSDSPQRNEDESTDCDPAGEPLGSPTPMATDRAATDSSVADVSAGAVSTNTPENVATIRTSGDDAEPAFESEHAAEPDVRVGSPFAVDPLEYDPARPIEAFYDVGPLKYTAMGAVIASVMVIGFAAAAAYFFPAGGTMIAALGCVLSIFGMYSSYRFTAAGLLAIHLSLFVLCYGRMLN